MTLVGQLCRLHLWPSCTSGRILSSWILRTFSPSLQQSLSRCLWCTWKGSSRTAPSKVTFGTVLPRLHAWRSSPRHAPPHYSPSYLTLCNQAWRELSFACSYSWGLTVAYSRKGASCSCVGHWCNLCQVCMCSTALRSVWLTSYPHMLRLMSNLFHLHVCRLQSHTASLQRIHLLALQTPLGSSRELLRQQWGKVHFGGRFC